jgi:hypothetical protein
MNTKLKEAAKRLKEVQKEQDAAHSAAHARDSHSIDRGDSYKPVKVVGGKTINLNSHSSEYQKKMLRGSREENTAGTSTRNLSMLARQQKAAGFPLFD